ncbi:hypothetical protein ACO0LM_15865 [Undibacterium sp. Di26W]|uniref:hypothetical protein n=1 Tax=Undibacterium sp. Di26W TaxID=3413035 RepID=UPI003BF286E5
MLYNPTRKRQVNEEGNLARVLRTEYDANRPMGNVAQHMLSDVVSAWLVGQDEQVGNIIPRSLQWIDKAFERDEKFGIDQNGYLTSLYWTKAVGEWMLDGVNSEGLWDNARIFEEARWRYEKRPWPTNEIIKSGLDDYMAFAYQGGEYNDGFEAGVDMFERWTGQKGVSLSKILKPREFAYALCLHRLARQQFDENELLEAGRKMLQANLQETWLGGGQYLRAATWLKIVYWHFADSLSPLETILKAYDNMPHIVRPDFLKL